MNKIAKHLMNIETVDVGIQHFTMGWQDLDIDFKAANLFL